MSENLLVSPPWVFPFFFSALRVSQWHSMSCVSVGVDVIPVGYDFFWEFNVRRPLPHHLALSSNVQSSNFVVYFNIANSSKHYEYGSHSLLGARTTPNLHDT
jgi:hypothetical protein